MLKIGGGRKTSLRAGFFSLCFGSDSDPGSRAGCSLALGGRSGVNYGVMGRPADGDDLV
jgi:hypothetical protein